MIEKSKRKWASPDWMAGASISLKTRPQAPHKSDQDALNQFQQRFPLWLAVLIMVLIFGSIPAHFVYRAIHRYQINEQILEASTINKEAKIQITLHAYSNTSPALDNAALGLPKPDAIRSRYVTSLEVRNNTIIVTLGGQAAKELQGKHLLFTPTGGKYGVDNWLCGSDDIARYLHPIACL